MSEQNSIWRKEITFRRPKAKGSAAVAHEPDWEVEKRAELWAVPEAVPATPVAALRAPSAKVGLDPKFRKLENLARLVDEHAEAFPQRRVDDWNKLLVRLAESAHKGVLPPDLDGVVHTLFHDLLHRGLKPSSGFWKKDVSRGERLKPAPAPKLAAAAPVKTPQPTQERAAATQPFWKKDLSLKRTPKTPKAVEAAVSEPKVKKESFLKKDLSLKRAPKAPKVVATADVSEPKVKKESFLKRDLSLKRAPKAVEADVSEPKVKGEPFWKRDLSFKRAPKQPKVTETGSLKVKKPFLKRDLSSLVSVKLPLGRSSSGDLSKIVGLRIGSSQLAAALVNNNGSAHLLQVARTPLQRGVVSGGEVRDPVALAEALKRFFAQHGLPRKGVRLGVATNRIGVRMLEVPVMEDDKQLANAIKFRAQELLPIPLAEAVLDQIVLGPVPDSDGKLLRVLLVFAHRELVENYMDACNRAGLKLCGIDFDAFALLRALSGKDGEEREAALVAVSIGHERTIFAVSDGKVCDFARVLEWGGSSVDAAIARALEIELDEAEGIKQHLTLTGDDTTGLAPMQVEAARAAVRHELQLLARELVSSLQFYQSRPGSLDLGEMLLTGGGAQLNGIDEELARALGVPVRVGDPLHHVTVGAQVGEPASAASLTIAVGLGIEA